MVFTTKIKSVQIYKIIIANIIKPVFTVYINNFSISWEKIKLPLSWPILLGCKNNKVSKINMYDFTSISTIIKSM